MLTANERAGATTWRWVLRAAAFADAGVLVVVGIVFQDQEALLFSGLILAALTFLRFRTGIAGAIIVGVLLLDTVVFMAPAAVSNLANREDVMAILIPASLAVISLTGVLAAIGSAFIKQPSARVAALVPQVLIAVFVVAVIAAFVQQRGDAAFSPQPGDLVVEMGSLSYSPDRLVAPSGSIGFAVSNGDLFWHTFTIDELKVNLTAPTGAGRRAVVDATPGTYEFYCAVPGHRGAGMEGTLVVR